MRMLSTLKCPLDGITETAAECTTSNVTWFKQSSRNAQCLVSQTDNLIKLKQSQQLITIISIITILLPLVSVSV